MIFAAPARRTSSLPCLSEAARPPKAGAGWGLLVRSESELTILVVQQGRGRLSRYRLTLEREAEAPADAKRLADLISHWAPDLLAIPAADFERVSAETLAGPHPLPLIPAPSPSRKAGWPLATVCLVIPPGADPTDPRVLVERLAHALLVSPTTGLLGTWALRQEVERRLSLSDKFCFLYADLDNFKGYNDRYGFDRGDRMIRHLADSCLAALAQAGHDSDLAAHMGGDDFALLTTLETARPVGERLIAEFDRAVPALYDPEDRERGCIEVKDRRGNPVRYPLASVSIAAVSTESRTIAGFPQLTAIAADLKAYAKSQPGSVYVADRRRDEGEG